jgi:nucleoside-diphosphate-sugar epimerase
VHLAFVIFGGHEETHAINLRGSRNVFEAAVAANAKRLVYTSSVAAYGFHDDNPDVLTEDVPPRGTRDFYYSAQKAELETLLDDVVAGSATQPFVFRPCIVAGRDAPTLIEGFTFQTILGPRVRPLWKALDSAPLIGPVLPETGTPFQLVHHDDVATAIRAAVAGQGAPGTYNLAAEDPITVSDVAAELGWRALRVPRPALGALAQVVAHAPFVPAQARWLNAIRKPVLMDTRKARRALRWRPAHDARETLRETAASARAAGIV